MAFADGLLPIWQDGINYLLTDVVTANDNLSNWQDDVKFLLGLALLDVAMWRDDIGLQLLSVQNQRIGIVPNDFFLNWNDGLALELITITNNGYGISSYGVVRYGDSAGVLGLGIIDLMPNMQDSLGSFANDYQIKIVESMLMADEFAKN